MIEKPCADLAPVTQGLIARAMYLHPQLIFVHSQYDPSDTSAGAVGVLPGPGQNVGNLVPRVAQTCLASFFHRNTPIRPRPLAGRILSRTRQGVPHLWRFCRLQQSAAPASA